MDPNTFTTVTVTDVNNITVTSFLIVDLLNKQPIQEAVVTQVQVSTWLVPVIFGLITICGVIGNSLVIYVICRHGSMKTVTNYYIINLAITDIAFLVCCAPFTASLYALPEWIFGRFLCKFVFYMMQVTAQATCMTLTAMSVDRYQAIVHPLRSLKTRTTKLATIVCIAIWTSSFLMSIPLAVYFDLDRNSYDGGVSYQTYCSEIWPLHLRYLLWPGYAIYAAVLMYLIPLLIISVCYSIMLLKVWTRVAPGEIGRTNGHHNANQVQQKRKVTRMVLAVVIVFAVCWFPIHTLNLWMRLSDKFPYLYPTYIFKVFAHTLSYANSCVNPFVYAFMGENFKKYLKKAFPVCFSKELLGHNERTEARTMETNT